MGLIHAAQYPIHLHNAKEFYPHMKTQRYSVSNRTMRSNMTQHCLSGVSSIFFHKCKVQTLTSFPGHIPGFFSPLIFLHGYEIVWVWHGKETTEALVRVSRTLVPRSLPDFIFLHSCEIKSVSGLGTRLGLRMLLLTHCTCIN